MYLLPRRLGPEEGMRSLARTRTWKIFEFVFNIRFLCIWYVDPTGMKLGFGLARETWTMTMTKRRSKSALEVFMAFVLVCGLVGGEEVRVVCLRSDNGFNLYWNTEMRDPHIFLASL